MLICSLAMRMRRHHPALLQFEAADGHPIAGDEAARDGLVDLLARHVDPAVMAHDSSRGLRYFLRGKSGRGSATKPLRFGIWIFGSVVWSSTSCSPTMPLRNRT